MTVPRDTLYTWITWITKLLVGENVCLWAAWFKSHFEKYEKAVSDFDSVGWNMRHTQALMELADRLGAGGCEVFIEDQNRSRVAGRESGPVMSGKPDLIALHPDGRATVYDVKTGRELDSHEAQVKLYMYLLPRARGTRWHGRTFDGCVVHGDGSEIPIPATAIDDEFRGMVSNLMRRVVSDTPARRVPSPHECGYCVLTSEDCPERIESEVAWPGRPDVECRESGGRGP